MEHQDHGAILSSGHASHGVHLCHKCGWPFPNPHPSARHRRAHKKVCGKVEGYKLTESEATHLAVSDDEHPSDDDRRTPSPKVTNKSFKESAASFKSTRSEDEDFSDAMADFSDSGLNPGMDEEGLEAAKKLGKHAQKFPGGDELPKVDATTDASKPLDDPLRMSELGEPQLPESEMKSLDATTPFGSKSEEDSIGLNEPSGQQLGTAPILENVKATGEEVVMSNDRKDICAKENEHANGSEILTDAVESSRDIAPSQSGISETDSLESEVQEGEEKTSSLSQKVEVLKADSKVSSFSSLEPELLEGVNEAPGHVIQGSKPVESVEADSKVPSFSSLEPELLEGAKETPGHVLHGSKPVESVEADSKVSSFSSLEHELLEGAKETPGHVIHGSKPVESVEADTKVSSFSSLEPELVEGARDTPGHIILGSKSNGADVKKSDQCQEDGNASEVVSVDRKSELSDELETKMGGRDKSGVFLQVSPLQNTDTEDIEGRCQNEIAEVENKEDVHLLSKDKDMSSLHNSELMVQEYKDHRSLKSNLALDLGAGDELISSAQDDVKSTPVEHQSRIDGCKPEQSLLGPPSMLDASGDDIKKDDDKVPIEVKNDENLGYSLSTPATLKSPILNFEPINGHSMEDESSQNAHSEENSIAPCMGGEIGQIIPTILDASEDDISKDVGELPIEGKIDPEEGSKAINDEESSQFSFEQCKQLGDSDNNSIAPCKGEEVGQTITPGGSEIFYDCAMDTTKASFTAINESREGHPQDEYSADTKIGFGLPDNSFVFEETQTPVSLAGSEHLEEAAKGKTVNIEPMHDSSVPVLESTNAAGDDERNHGNVEHISSISGKHADVREKCDEGPTFTESASLPDDSNSGNSATVENNNNNIVDAKSTTGVGSLKGEGDDKITKQQDGVVTPLDLSVASSSRTDSLEANWGSVSVLSIQSESTAPVDCENSSLQKTKVERNHDKSDSYEAPSFMTLVESGSGLDPKAGSEIENAQHPKSEALKAGWFPSINNVVNESQGRKKNEEIIAKVTNWSSGKQHTPLKNLLGEAKSPNTKQVPSALQQDETATAAKVTTVNSIMGYETASEMTGQKEEAEKEWDSPARYPVGIKKEKKKGKAYWVPFVCCSSVH